MKKILIGLFCVFGIGALVFVISQLNTTNEAISNNKETDVNITVTARTINSLNLVSTSKLNVISKISVENLIISTIDDSTLTVKGKNFGILLSYGGEGSPIGLEKPVPNFESLNTQLGTIYRVDANIDASIEAIYNKNINFKSRYYYSSSFMKDSECGSEWDGYFCGLRYIQLEEDTENYPLYIYCATESLLDVKYCDEFVSNLQTQITKNDV